MVEDAHPTYRRKAERCSGEEALLLEELRYGLFLGQQLASFEKS